MTTRSHAEAGARDISKPRRKEKTAREKLAAKKQIKKVVMEKPFGGIRAGETMLVATPQMVDAYIREIPHGSHRTIPEMRAELARQIPGFSFNVD